MADINQRMHSGEHVFVQSLIRQDCGVNVEKVELGEKESRVFVSADKLSWEAVFKAEKLANDVIKEERNITIKNITKEEAEKLPDIRIKVDRLRGDKVQVVEINDFDLSACAGNHCSNTSEIGGFLVTGFNSLGGQKYELRYTVDTEGELLGQSQKLRKIMSLLNTDDEKIVEAVKNLLEKNKNLTENIRDFQKDQPLNVDEEKIKGINFVHGVFDNYEKLILMKKINEYAKNKTVVCFLNTLEKGTYVIISVSEDSGKNANDLLQKILKEFNGKGGGKINFASGFVDVKYKEKVIPKLKELL